MEKIGNYIKKKTDKREENGMYHLDEGQIKDITDYIFLEDALSPSDVIFIPGCARPEHTEEAARLYQEGYAPILIPSGGYTKAEGGFRGVKGGAKKYGTDFSCEADFLEAVLLYHGVPRTAILKESQATYTLENAEKTRSLLEERGRKIHRAILCCKNYHARRSYLYYHMVFPEVQILVHPVPLDGITRDTWHLTKEGRQIVFGELARMGQQLAMMEGRIAY